MAMVEILIGCVACRMIMVKECDPAEDPEGAKDSRAGILLGGAQEPSRPPRPFPSSAVWAVIFSRAVGWLSLNDQSSPAAPSSAVHRLRHARASATVYSDLPKADVPGHRSFSTMLGAKWLTYLGPSAFPIPTSCTDPSGRSSTSARWRPSSSTGR